MEIYEKGLLKNVHAGISRQLGSREIHKVKHIGGKGWEEGGGCFRFKSLWLCMIFGVKHF